MLGETKKKEFIMLNYRSITASCFTLIMSFLLNTCIAQIIESMPVITTIIHKDSISLRSENLPEFKVDKFNKESEGNQLSGVVRSVIQDKEGNFWFGTQNGLCRHDQSGLVYFNLTDSNGRSVTIHVIIEDKTGNIWIGYGGGIAKYDGQYFTMYHEKDILADNGLWSMVMDKKGMLWIATTLGVYSFDGKTLTLFEIPEGKIDATKGISTTKMIHSIIEDSKGKIWFATNGGVYIYDGMALENISEKDGLLSDFVNQVIEVADGNYWISTSKGLFQYDGKLVTNLSEKLFNKNESIDCMYEDKSGTLWFTLNKREIYSYNGKIHTQIQSAKDGFKPFPFQIYQDQQERIWFVGFKGAYRFENDLFINVTRNGPW